MSAVGAGLMLTGSALTLVAAVGVYRFPDLVTRLHAATKAASVGFALVIVGAGAVLGPGALAFTTLVATFQILTAPIAAHALGRAALPETERARSASAALPRTARVVALAAVWVILWGAATPANVIGGLAVGVLVTALTLRRGHESVRIRPVAAVRLAAVFLVLLVKSTITVAVAAVGPRRLVDPAVRRVPVRPGSISALVAAANAVSLTPGTLTLALDTAEPALVVHLIRPDEATLEAITTLHALATATLPAEASPPGDHP